MDKKSNFINLTEDLFVGRGRHRECYRYPGDSMRCVKVAYNHGGTVDLVRETKYRRILQWHHVDASILPKYYGTVETNKGKGYVYELIRDYDGNVSKSLADFLKDEKLMREHFDMLVEQMKIFHKLIYTNSIITMTIAPENIIVQQLSDGGGTIHFPFN